MPKKPMPKAKSITTITLDSAAEKAKLESKMAAGPSGAKGMEAAMPFPHMPVPGMPYFQGYQGPFPGGPVPPFASPVAPDMQAAAPLSSNLGTMMRLGIEFINSALSTGIQMMGGNAGGCSCGGHHQSSCGCGGESRCDEHEDDCCSCYGHDRCNPSVHGCHH